MKESAENDTQQEALERKNAEAVFNTLRKVTRDVDSLTDRATITAVEYGVVPGVNQYFDSLMYSLAHNHTRAEEIIKQLSNKTKLWDASTADVEEMKTLTEEMEIKSAEVKKWLPESSRSLH